MDIRSIDLNKDHLILTEWWSQYNWPSVKKELLPTTGYIIDDFCAGFLYETNSKFCLLEFVVSNKNSDRVNKDRALDLLLESLLKLAKEKQFSIVFSSLEHPKLIERYKSHGFQISDTNMTNLVRIL